MIYFNTCFLCFFFKQKTAYEMRISDWSSDVCSSDLVIDGSNTPAYSADVAIRAGRIERIADLRDAQAIEEIDAAGCVLAPGFIDVHTHDDTVEIGRAHV